MVMMKMSMIIMMMKVNDDNSRDDALVKIHLQGRDFPRLPVFPEPPRNIEQDGLGR